jgi:predicted Fe-S protein YdhL (DUF1289 family)
LKWTRGMEGSRGASKTLLSPCQIVCPLDSEGCCMACWLSQQDEFLNHQCLNS